MSKRIKIFLILIIGVAILGWFFAESISQMLQTLWELDDATRDKINDWTSIGSGLTAILATLTGVIFWILNLGREKPKNDISLTSSNPALANVNELEEYYYSNLAEQCQRYDLGSFRDSRSASEQTAIQVKLSDVYVDLMAHEVKPHKEKSNKSKKREEQGEMRQSKLLLDVLNDEKLDRIVIRGDVGSCRWCFREGKSLRPT